MLQGIRFRRVQILQFWWDNLKQLFNFVQCTMYVQFTPALTQVTPGTRRLETVPGTITGIHSSCWETSWRSTMRRSSSGCLMTTSYTTTPSRDYSLTTNTHIKEWTSFTLQIFSLSQFPSFFNLWYFKKNFERIKKNIEVSFFLCTCALKCQKFRLLIFRLYLI